MVGWDWVHLVQRSLTGLLYQPRMIDDVCGAFGGMTIGKGNRSNYSENTCPSATFPPQIPHDLTWARTRAAAVGSRRLTVWALRSLITQHLIHWLYVRFLLVRRLSMNYFFKACSRFISAMSRPAVFIVSAVRLRVSNIWSTTFHFYLDEFYSLNCLFSFFCRFYSRPAGHVFKDYTSVSADVVTVPHYILLSHHSVLVTDNQHSN
jgi:hypothetical protein